MKALILIVALTGVAVAAPDPAVVAKADALFVKGQASYNEGKYQAAIAQFKQAYELVKDAVYLFNIAQSYRKVGDCSAAYDYYTQYLEAAPNAENKDKVKQWLTELKPCVDQRQKEQEEAARKAQVEAERKQRDTAPTLEEQRDHGKPYRIAGIALGGVGIVGLGIGIGFGIRGASLKSEVADKCNMSCVWDSMEIQDLHQAGQRANTLSWIGYVGGGVALAGGVALYWYGRSRVETVTVAPTAGGATVSAQLHF